MLFHCCQVMQYSLVQRCWSWDAELAEILLPHVRHFTFLPLLLSLCLPLPLSGPAGDCVCSSPVFGSPGGERGRSEPRPAVCSGRGLVSRDFSRRRDLARDLSRPRERRRRSRCLESFFSFREVLVGSLSFCLSFLCCFVSVLPCCASESASFTADVSSASVSWSDFSDSSTSVSLEEAAGIFSGGENGDLLPMHLAQRKRGKRGIYIYIIYIYICLAYKVYTLGKKV